MSRILIVYGTTDGQTAKIARFLGSELQAAGTEVDVVAAGPRAPAPRDYDGVIVAASVHAGGHQRSVVNWVRAHLTGLPDKPSVFISVCLAILQRDPAAQRELAGIHERFVERTGWRPPRLRVVAGALKYTEYGWLKRRIMRSISRRAGGDTDMSRDYEYTDWTELRELAREFHNLIEPSDAHYAVHAGAADY